MRRAFLFVLPNGPAAEVEQRAVIGRSPDCELSVPRSGSVSRRHAEVSRQGDGFLIRDLGSTGGTWVKSGPGRAERMQERPLLDGDRIIFAEFQVVFTLDRPLHPDPDQRVLELEAALCASPDDESVWRVYGDALLELGDRRGERVAQQSVTWPDSANQLAAATELNVSWRFGHAREAWVAGTPRLIRAEPQFRDDPLPARTLRELFESPLGRFLETLHLDLPADRPDLTARTLAALSKLSHPTLRRVTFGPFFEPSGAAIPPHPLTGPHLRPPEVLSYGAAWLERDGVRTPLERSRAVQLSPIPQRQLEVGYADRRWRLLATSSGAGGFFLNARKVELASSHRVEHLLRPGDVIVIEGRTLRFDAEPAN